MMDAPIAACIIAGCLFVGGVGGAIESAGNKMYYDSFLADPDNYHLVDSFGNPVSQEAE